MSKAPNNQNKKLKQAKVGDFIRILDSVNALTSNCLLNCRHSTEDLTKLKEVLKPIRKWNFIDFITFLQENLPSEVEQVNKKNTVEVKSLTKEDILELCKNHHNINKVVFEEIGHKLLGFSISSLKSKTKDETISMISSALDNVEILNSIAHRAKGKEE